MGAVGATSPSPSPSDAKAAVADAKSLTEVPGTDGDLFTVKINGQERKVSAQDVARTLQMPTEKFKALVDSVGSENVLRVYQTHIASSLRMQETAKQRKDLEGILGNIKQNPLETLERILGHESVGLNLDEIATQALSRKFELAAMTPEQREIAELRRFKETTEAKEKAAEEKRVAEAKKAAEAERNEKVKTIQSQIETEISTAIEKSGMATTAGNKQRVARYLYQAASQGLHCTTEQAINLVREDLLAEHKQMFGSVEDPEKLIGLIGPDVVERIRGHQLDKAKADLNSGEAQKVTPIEPRRRAKEEPSTRRLGVNKPETFTEARARIARIYGNK